MDISPAQLRAEYKYAVNIGRARAYRHGIGADEGESIAGEVLTKAISKWKPDGVSFRTFVDWQIGFAILDYKRQVFGDERRPAQRCVPVQFTHRYAGVTGPEAHEARAQLALVGRALDRMAPTARRLVLTLVTGEPLRTGTAKKPTWECRQRQAAVAQLQAVCG
jgi:hypothetical protein